jgi:hypothetical protein
MILVFNAMKDRFQASKDFISRISNLANIHDQQAIKMGYSAIISYARAKNYVYKKKKENASKDIYYILNNLMTRRMNNYYSDLKFRTLAKHKQAL